MITAVLVGTILLGGLALAGATFGPQDAEAKSAARVASVCTFLVTGGVLALFKLYGG